MFKFSDKFYEHFQPVGLIVVYLENKIKFKLTRPNEIFCVNVFITYSHLRFVTQVGI